MDPNTNKIYLAIGATATILAGALGYYILVLKKSKNKVILSVVEIFFEKITELSKLII